MPANDLATIAGRRRQVHGGRCTWSAVRCSVRLQLCVYNYACSWIKASAPWVPSATAAASLHPFTLSLPQAIISGLRESVASFSNEVTDVNSKEVMELLVLTQYFDVLRDIGMSGKSNTVSRGESVVGYGAVDM